MEGNPALKFAYKYRQAVAFALYLSLLCGIAAPTVFARPAPPARPGAPRVDRAPVSTGGSLVPLRSNNGLDVGKFVPDGVTRRSTKGVKGFARTRVQVGGVNGANVQEQVVDITNFANLISDEIDPYWSPDEQYIFFSSNRDYVGTGVPGNNQLWRIVSNPSPNPNTTGTEPARLTNEAGAIHRFPTISASNRIAFVKSTDNGATFQLYFAFVPAGATSATAPADTASVTLPTNLTSLTAGKQIGARNIVSVGRPAWLSSTEIAFSATLSDNQSDILSVDIQTGLIRQITSSPANETNVAVSADGRFLAFDSDAAGYSAAAPAVSTGVTAGVRNVFVTSSFGSDAIQVTGGTGSGVAAGVSSVQPAWSRNAVTPLFQTESNYYLAFSSDRVAAVAPATGYVKNTNGTKDIYYEQVAIPVGTGVQAQIEGDATNIGASNTFQGVVGNVAPFKLDTGDSDALTPSRYDDEYPTFPPLLNAIRIGFQSNRKGSTGAGFTAPNPNTPANAHDLFIASVVDLSAPTLLRYDLSNPTGEIVHINLGTKFDPNTGSSVRNRGQGLTPGTDVFFTVRAEDLESGVSSAYIQIKNPNSKYQSQAQGGDGNEHKEYAPGAFVIYEPFNNSNFPLWWQPAGQPARNVGLEYECQVLGASDGRYYSHGLVGGVFYKRGGLNVPSNVPNMYDAGGGIQNMTLADPRGSFFGAFAQVGEDGQAFSGTNHPAPLDAGGKNIWVQLQRIDKISTQLAGQYPGGRDGNGGVLFGATYKTTGEPSDWFLDVILYDNAVNPFDPTGSKGNWIIYDNVWGFSTAPSFNANPIDILVVSDYMLGQKFLTGRVNRAGTSGQSTQQQDNLPNVIYGGESYITDSDVKRFPDGLTAPAAPAVPPGINRLWEGGFKFGNFNVSGGPFLTGVVTVPSPSSLGNGGTPNPLGVGSYIDDLLTGDSVIADQGSDGTDRRLPSVGRYNIWRVLSRGPVPANVLNDYLPFRTTAPPDVKAGETIARSVLNVNRMVIWASSFTQITYRGVGTIADLQTQQDLTNFVNAGGQLFVSGQDVAFALAGNGQANPFVNQVLGVSFVNNNAGGIFQLGYNAPTPVSALTKSGYLTARIGKDSLNSGANSAFHIATPRGYSPPSSEPLDLENLPGLIPAMDYRGSASGIGAARSGTLFSGFEDVVQATSPTTSQIYGYAGGGGLFVNALGNGGTTVFASFAFESLTEGFYSYTPTGATTATLAWRGRRSEIMHNITDALRTATVTGRLLDDNNSPVTDALVRVFVTGRKATDPSQGTALTDGDGNYQVAGLEGGFFLVEGFKTGYYTQVSSGNVVHGGSRATVNLILKRAGPGRLSGIRDTSALPLKKTRKNPDNSPRTAGGVFKTDDRIPLGGIPVMAYFAQASATATRFVAFTTVTSDGTQRDTAGGLIPVGQYVFPQDLPIGNYQLVVNPTRVVDPTTGALVPNTGQLTATINGRTVVIPAASPIFRQNVYVLASLNGKIGPGVTGIDILGDDPGTPQNEATIVLSNPNKTVDLPGDFVQIEENKGAAVDFRISSGEQRITGEVRQQNADGTAGPGVKGVTVQATVQGGGAVVGTGTTDANGAFALAYNNGTPNDATDDRATFPENIYTVSVVGAAGYDLVAKPTGTSTRPSVDVSVGGDTNATVRIIEPRVEANALVQPGALIIAKLPPGSVSGLVTRVPGSVATVGATVNLYLSDAAGNKLGDGTPRYSTPTVAVQTVNGYTFNYLFTSVETGTYVADVALRGFSPNPVISSVFAVTSGKETQNINFSLEAPKIFGAGVQLVSIPLDYSATTAATNPRLIFGLQQGADNNGDGVVNAADDALFNGFNIAEWAGGPDYNRGPNIPLVRGKGYFVRFGGVTSVTDSDAVGATGNDFTVTLLPGWNLIGHPFARTDNPYATPADIDIANGTRYIGPDGVESTYDQAIAKGYIRGVAYGYTGENSNSQYFQSPVLKPYLGYWFRNTSAQNIQMKFLRPADATSTRAYPGHKAGAAISRAEREKLRFRSIESKNAMDWRLQLAVRQGDLLDTDNSVGVAPGAKDGFDTQFDTEKPPVIGAAPMVYLSIEGKDTKGGRAVLADDIRDGSQVGVGKRSWDFTVQPAEGKGDVTVFWPNVNRLPRGVEPFLVDTVTNKRIPLRSASSFTYTPTGAEMGGRSVHRFRIEVAKPSSLPLMLTRVHQTRVDGRGVGAGGYRIGFTVTREADVTAEIQTLTGRTVSVLSTRARSGGESVLFWNGRSQDGSDLAAGIYVLTLTARDTDGSQVQTRLPITSLR